MSSVYSRVSRLAFCWVGWAPRECLCPLSFRTLALTLSRKLTQFPPLSFRWGGGRQPVTATYSQWVCWRCVRKVRLGILVCLCLCCLLVSPRARARVRVDWSLVGCLVPAPGPGCVWISSFLVSCLCVVVSSCLSSLLLSVLSFGQSLRPGPGACGLSNGWLISPRARARVRVARSSFSLPLLFSALVPRPWGQSLGSQGALHLLNHQSD